MCSLLSSKIFDKLLSFWEVVESGGFVVAPVCRMQPGDGAYKVADVNASNYYGLVFRVWLEFHSPPRVPSSSQNLGFVEEHSVFEDTV